MNAGTEQLHGWKEIACYLKRSVRCVQRWERNEKLPVLRHGHAHGVSVDAFRDELEAWWENEQRSSKESEETSRISAEIQATKDKVVDAKGWVLDAGALGDDGSYWGLTDFKLTPRDIAMFALLLRLLESRYSAEISEQELEAIKARYELLGVKDSGNGQRHVELADALPPISTEGALPVTTKSEIRRQLATGRALAGVVACASGRTSRKMRSPYGKPPVTSPNRGVEPRWVNFPVPPNAAQSDPVAPLLPGQLACYLPPEAARAGSEAERRLA